MQHKNQDRNQELILQDIKSNGKEINWKSKKLNSSVVADTFTRVISYSKGAKINDCGSLLWFRYFLSDKPIPMELAYASFCKNRMCPMCAWRRSLKVKANVAKIMNFMADSDGYKDYRYLFLTLTQKNVSADELNDELKKISSCFMKMFRWVEVKRMNNGFIKSIEITYNQEADTYHAHIHAVIAVNKSYFTNPKLYIKQMRWRELWKKALNIDYLPIINIKTVKPDEGSGEVFTDDNGNPMLDHEGNIMRFPMTYNNVIPEIVKYSVKSSDYIIRDKDTGELDKDTTDTVISVLASALFRKRLVSFSGVFKIVAAIINIPDEDKADLNDDFEDDYEKDYLYKRYGWKENLKNYYHDRYLNADDFERIFYRDKEGRGK